MLKETRKTIQLVPITEFRHHIKRWIEFCQHEDIAITRYGKPIIYVMGYLRWLEIENLIANLRKKRNLDSSAG